MFARTLYLVRHGAYLPDDKSDSQPGPGLSPLGIAQARLVAARLRSLPVNFDSMTTSTMTRARETSAVMHETLRNLPLTQSHLLAECAPPAWATLKDETLAEQLACARRLDQVFAERFKRAEKREAHEIVVAHGNVIRYLVTKALGADTRAWLGMSVAHASLTVIQARADGSMKVLTVGDSGHIPASLLSWGTDSDPQLEVPSY